MSNDNLSDTDQSSTFIGASPGEALEENSTAEEVFNHDDDEDTPSDLTDYEPTEEEVLEEFSEFANDR